MALPVWCHASTGFELMTLARSQPDNRQHRLVLAFWLQDNRFDDDSIALGESLYASLGTDKLVLLPPETAQRLHPFVGALQGWFHGVQDNSDEVARLWLLPPGSIELDPGVWLEMLTIPAGTFLMGSPKSEKNRHRHIETQHKVTLSQPFLIGKYPVTQAQWKAIMGSNPSRFQGDTLPVERVSLDCAQDFCQKVLDKTGQAVCLPNESQWEYCCRAGTSTPFHFGNELNGTQANCDGDYPYGTTQKGPYRKKTTPVGSYPANAWGVYDMHGNVFECCQICHGIYPRKGITDPRGPEVGSDYRIRGGSWCNGPALCRAAFRGRRGQQIEPNEFGIRLTQNASGILK